MNCLSLDFSNYQDSDASEKNNDFILEYSFASVVFQKRYFWSKSNLYRLRIKSLKIERNQNKQYLLFFFLRKVKTLMPGTHLDNSAIGKITRTGTFSIPTLMEEIKPSVWLKQEFENREKIKLPGFLPNFPTIRILLQVKNSTCS